MCTLKTVGRFFDLGCMDPSGGQKRTVARTDNRSILSVFILNINSVSHVLIQETGLQNDWTASQTLARKKPGPAQNIVFGS